MLAATLIVAWTFRIFVLYPQLDLRLVGLTRVLASPLITTLCSVVPVIAWASRFEQSLRIESLGLSVPNFRASTWVTLASAIMTGFFLIIFHHTAPGIHHILVLQWMVLITNIFAEEFAFRGYLLRVTTTAVRSPIAVALLAILFVGFHFPSWGLNHMPHTWMLRESVATFVLSIALGCLALSSRSIWLGIVIHVAYDYFLLPTA